MKTIFYYKVQTMYPTWCYLKQLGGKKKHQKKNHSVVFVLVLIGLLMMLYDLRIILDLCFCLSRRLMVLRTFYYAMLHLCVRTYCCLVVPDMLYVFYYLG